MSGDSSEEKTLPPSQKKLRDARKKGQIAKSRDLVSALGLLAATAFLWARSESLVDEWRHEQDQTLPQTVKLLVVVAVLALFVPLLSAPLIEGAKQVFSEFPALTSPG